MHFSGVLFDKDGTLFDFHATWGAWAHGFLMDLSGGDAFRLEALAQAIEYDLSTGRFLPGSIAIAGTPGEIAACLLPVLPGTTPAALITRVNRSAAQAPLREAAPLKPLLGALRAQGYKLGVATNDAEAPCRAHLKQAGVCDIFDFVAGFDTGYGAKPDPGQLQAFADRMRLEPHTVVMVGDSRHDLLAARAAGMFPVGVLTGMASEEELAPFADLVLPSIADLPGWLREASLLEAAAE